MILVNFFKKKKGYIKEINNLKNWNCLIMVWYLVILGEEILNCMYLEI